jgi:hypothetical protein
LRRIEQETGVRGETAGTYLKAAGIGVRPPGAWGRRTGKTGQGGHHRVGRGKTAANAVNTNINTDTENPSNNVLSEAKKQRVIALGRLGWP